VGVAYLESDNTESGYQAHIII